MQGREVRKFTIEDYNQVIEFKNKGFSQNEIHKRIGVSSATVWHWINTDRKPRCLYAKRKQRKMLEKSKKLSPELSYIYGVLIGDGHIENSKLTQRIYLGVTDKDFALEFAKVLKKWTGFDPTINLRKATGYRRKSKYGNWIENKKDQYIVRLGSKQIVKFLVDKANTRTYSWKIPEDILKFSDEKIIASFLKGIFDSEGCVVFDKVYNKKRIDLRMYGKEVRKLKELLKKLRIDSRIKQYGKDKDSGVFLLRILGKENLVLFDRKIGLTIRRKQIKLEEALNSFKRDAFDGNATRKDIISSLKEKPKTSKEIAKSIDKSISTIRYQMKKIDCGIKVINKIKKERVFGF